MMPICQLVKSLAQKYVLVKFNISKNISRVINVEDQHLPDWLTDGMEMTNGQNDEISVAPVPFHGLS